MASNGVEGKVIAKIGDAKYDGLPILSNTSEVYIKRSSKGELIQIRIYKDRKPVIDLDWDHGHRNADGRLFHIGVVHVQKWYLDKNGKYCRDNKHARLMNNSEMKRYGPLIKTIRKDIKLRPNNYSSRKED